MKKKIFAMLFLSVFILSFAGCSSNKTDSNNSKKLKIVTYANWNPFEYLDNGNLVGFDIDLIKAAAKEAGYDYEIKNVGWDAMFTQIGNKTADLGISGITITDDRKQTYDFSIPYFVSRQSILVKKDSSIKSGKDLKGKTVAVQSGSTGQEAVEKLLGKNNPNIKKVKTGLSYMELIHGGADAVVGDDTSNRSFLANNSQEGLSIIQDNKTFSPEYFGIIFPKGSKLKTDFNKALNKLYDNGKFSSIYKKWFKVDPNMEELKSQN
ncbi:MAG: basic amino acid ABC transporter substrate-binding protein [Clostridium sp.]|jgi:polar amino acid transport system substrate-binding protein|uniref:basic amino acid ABC transporter substrate-binding protein n=1 Tax=Clostridium sp. TaxID=1506 RepID=UPI0025C33431|nr:basic amino acid ABC transporter substrate-binding protein [Clostridium sp.]MCH3964879.1 basic amino acid ABC transporter substrate-binding protein [Clostridium sp.]MCI1716626.1 basic amino acid ABC transporter substrate-binding protein [Clostridium sp.]MCI1800892.1 basic amino acid ABC transporter substrate-binding protein [Clostridium sp.]MCI1814803.1 basic amino acid ABC transporter substrate-binding protein [Clostridium sp.]MCI1871639.1 basic amino acid ABC transporter substrate-binding